MNYKVSIRRIGKRKRSKKHWWITCPLCKTRSHVRQSHWASAITMADAHIHGKQHSNRIAYLRSTTCLK